MANSRGRTFRAGPRRKTTWFGGPGGTVETSFSASGVAFVGSAVTPAAGQEDGTIVRTRGLVDIFLNDGVTSDGDGYFGAVGIGLATAAAVAAGVASVPTPITELFWDGWLWHSFFSVHGSATDAGSPSRAQRLVIDSKAMRKFETGMAVFMAAEVVERGTAALEIYSFSRQLCKLH